MVYGHFVGYYTLLFFFDGSTVMFKGNLVALVTPMLEDESIDFVGINALIDHHLASGTDGFVIIGTTAESATLEFSERMDIIQYTIECINKKTAANGKRPYIIVGNGSNCTRHSVDRTIELNSFDIDGYLTVVPYYNKPSQNGLVAHFSAVAEASDKPVILYNVPGRTVVDMLPQTVAELAKVDNIVGIKEASGLIERVSEIKQLCGEDFICLSGDDPTSCEFMKLGGDGVISVTSNVAPQLMTQMCHAALSGNFALAQELDQKLALLHQRLFVEPNPVPTKWVLQQLGLISAPQVRLPLLSLEPIHHSAVKEAMKVAGLI